MSQDPHPECCSSIRRLEQQLIDQKLSHLTELDKLNAMHYDQDPQPPNPAPSVFPALFAQLSACTATETKAF